MAGAESYPVGQAPWESGGSKDSLPDSFPVGQAPWETPAKDNKSWLDTDIPGGTPRGYIQGALNTLPTAGMVAGGVAGGVAGTALEPVGGTAAGAVGGAALGGGAGESLKNLGEQYLLGQDKTRSEIYGNPAKGVVEGAAAEVGGQLLGKGLEAAAGTKAGKYVLQKASEVPTWAAQKVGKILSNIPENTTGRYIADRASINAAPERSNIADNILNLKNQADDQLAKAQEDLAQAKSAVTENKGDVRAGLQDQKFEASHNLQDAQQAFNEKKQAFKEALKSNKLTSMASDVTDALGKLKEQVVAGSNDAYSTLFKAGGQVETKPLVNVLQNHIDSMMVNGVPASTSAEQSVKELQAMQDRLSKMGKNIMMPQAKQILQGLDKDIQYSNSVASFAPQSEQALSDMRSYLDGEVKSRVPEYKAQMTDVARQSRLLNVASDLYGTPEKAIGNLNSITSQKGQALHAPLLEAIGRETGKDLSSPVNDYLMNHKILTTPSLFDRTIEAIPEAKTLNAAKTKMGSIADPAYARAVSESSSAPLASRADRAQAAVDAAKQNKQLFSGITPDSVTSKTKALGGANQYGAQERFGNIDEALGTNFQKQILARNDLDQFSKSDTHGSRKAVLGGAIGAGIGAIFHEPILGVELGTAAGVAADKYSGELFKYALDKGLNTAEAMGFAKKAAQDLSLGKTAGSVLSKKIIPSVEASRMVAGQPLPTKGPDKWANDGMQNLLEHDPKALNGFTQEDLKDPKTKELFIQASDLNPGSAAMQKVMDKVKGRMGKGKN